MKFWRSTFETSKSWHAQSSIGRVQFGWHVHHHQPSRWVFQPFLIVDFR